MAPADEAKAKADAIERARLGGYSDALYGAVTVAVGAPVFLWHLRQARRREPELLAAQSPTTAA
jgi:ABC-type cobalamin transport system permease subunit